MSDLDGLRGQRFATLNDASIPATRVLGVPVSLVSLAVAVRTIVSWCEAGTAHFVCVRDVHGIMRAQDDPALMALHEQAGLVTPDGMPLVWLARHRGHNGVDRVCGSDLVTALSRVSVDKGIRHYFYGGKPGVAERMAAALSERYPGLEVAGTYTPPFRALTVQEDSAVTAAIVAARPHIVWVGLSTPTQEYWMRDHVDRIPGATLIGVGAAFDFHTGDVKRAPVWMRSRGLEWLHRLVSEPRRLWRRYLVLAPRFVVAVAQEQRGR
ncbi:WecB/TagA/CpsF family glycosyltransferase [Sphingomonas sp. R86520]|uniref:WecB/TagA/CpsF family glycosyltransferase n=1 Tax=Sphingomonas sp. R86520 TaxID=3093859 RepID=UPI0036D20FE2